LLLFSLVIVGLGALLAFWTITLQERTSWQSYFLLMIMLTIVAYMAGGALITEAMGAIGVSIWQFLLAVGGQLLLGLLAMKYLPRLKVFSR
jgi:hypothetical protein